MHYIIRISINSCIKFKRIIIYKNLQLLNRYRPIELKNVAIIATVVLAMIGMISTLRWFVSDDIQKTHEPEQMAGTKLLIHKFTRYNTYMQFNALFTFVVLLILNIYNFPEKFLIIFPPKNIH